MFEYRKICEELLSSLPERTRNIVARRFGIFDNQKTTLEAIGKEYDITRERVRQIEKDGIKQIKKETSKYKNLFDYFKEKFDSFGGVKREDFLIACLTDNEDNKNCLVFLLSISVDIVRVPENQDFYSFWMRDKKYLEMAKEVINEAYKKLQKENKLLSLENLNLRSDLSQETLLSYLEISKRVVENEEGVFGLSKWPEINPRGIKDKAYLIFKKEGKPLHFREVASMLGENANPQTTHNELIKDSRFVLIGRGVYALSEWGYTPGEVKEVIRGILKEEGALEKKEIIIRVSKQRIVKKNTIIQNLSNKKYFIRTPDGKYTVA